MLKPRIHVAPGFSPVSKLPPSAIPEKSLIRGGMSLESIQKVRAEARGHMKTSMFSGPDVCVQIKVSDSNE